MASHQSADVSLTVPFDAVHLILVLLVGCAEIRCFGFICLQSISKRLLSLLPGCFLLLDLKDTTHTHTIILKPKPKTSKRVILIYKHMSSPIRQL